MRIVAVRTAGETDCSAGNVWGCGAVMRTSLQKRHVLKIYTGESGNNRLIRVVVDITLRI